jgi:hypothetical protein
VRVSTLIAPSTRSLAYVVQAQTVNFVSANEFEFHCMFMALDHTPPLFTTSSPPNLQQQSALQAGRQASSGASAVGIAMQRTVALAVLLSQSGYAASGPKTFGVGRSQIVLKTSTQFGESCSTLTAVVPPLMLSLSLPDQMWDRAHIPT